eukprot:CAMPEP_0181242386 /NCGR_PEP_ID=MMETSP1096-20121128/41657_1 /TAXON_ID=156174 ORGANISM="Chrysochromulina ericina, Strain CCMP281" /NCGR_SAMPLE_ID=MMETSP1096 /ASSEMBLY_ACC=CAM_ASM_000453 /LENGTH=49 /DNA_ID= /DNA_START= /DNA_END= /DNA_ORIENTATION=
MSAGGNELHHDGRGRNTLQVSKMRSWNGLREWWGVTCESARGRKGWQGG